MAGEKKYFSFTGLKEFYYGELDAAGTKIKDQQAERIKFLQNISIETEQSIEKAYGDNEIAEMALSTGSTKLTTTFHTIPVEDRARLYGLETVDGLSGLSNNPNPPYVACMFARTSENGGMEWIGFTKGIFMLPNTEGKTKEDSVEFGNAETEGEFMSREVDGADKKITFLIGYDEPGETTQRDALYEKIFGVAYPSESSGGGTEGA